jgi:hypothetical protein
LNSFKFPISHEEKKYFRGRKSGLKFFRKFYELSRGILGVFNVYFAAAAVINEFLGNFFDGEKGGGRKMSQS